jgi:hypothetical protein
VSGDMTFSGEVSGCRFESRPTWTASKQ